MIVCASHLILSCFILLLSLLFQILVFTIIIIHVFFMYIRCAAHLAMLCEHAIEANRLYDHYGDDAITADQRRRKEGFIRAGRLAYGVQRGGKRGMLVNYESLPGLLVDVLLKLFGVEGSLTWTINMQREAMAYSKSNARNILKAGKFSEDSKWKETHATAAVIEWANKMLGPSYKTMLNITEQSLIAMNYEIPRDKGGTVDWGAMKTIQSGGNTAHRNDLPFNPFQSSHNSTPFEVRHVYDVIWHYIV